MAKRKPKVISEKIGNCTFCEQKDVLVAKYRKGWICGSCINPPDPKQRATDYLEFGKSDRLANYPRSPSAGDLVALQRILRKRKKDKLNPWDDWAGTTGVFQKE